jgi:hypothetical protein
MSYCNSSTSYGTAQLDFSFFFSLKQTNKTKKYLKMGQLFSLLVTQCPQILTKRIIFTYYSTYLFIFVLNIFLRKEWIIHTQVP